MFETSFNFTDSIIDFLMYIMSRLDMTNLELRGTINWATKLKELGNSFKSYRISD